MALIGAKRLGNLGLSPNGWNQSRNFPVFFPVSRDLPWRKVRVRLRPPPASLRNSLSVQPISESIEFAARKKGKCHGDRGLQALLTGNVTPSVRFFSASRLGSSLSPEPEPHWTLGPSKKGSREFELTALRQRVSDILSSKPRTEAPDSGR